MARDYTEKLKEALPPGKAWTRRVGSWLHKLTAGASIEFGRVEGRVEQLLLEMWPGTAVETIADWERILGLPDTCADAPSTLALRQAAAESAFVSRGGSLGGPSVPFLTRLIERLGYTGDGDIIIRRFHFPAFDCESECTAALNPDEVRWPFVWEFVVKSGDLDEVLVCRVERNALAHLGLTHAFPIVMMDELTMSRTGVAVLHHPENQEETALADGEVGTFYYGA